MDTPKYQKSDPAILLLNEIDILSAQTRLMELYLKQAQATAANENARLQEHYESQLASLRADLAAKEKQLQEHPVVAVESNLSAAVEQLQRELSDKQQFLSGHEAALQRSSSEIIALQNRIAQLEAETNAAVSAARESNAIRENLSAEIAALNQELENNRREFHQQQLAAQEIESSLREQLQRLQNQVAEHQANAIGSTENLRQAQQEIAALRQHLGSLEALQDELQANAARELEQARGRFESEMASLRTALAERERTVVESQTSLLEIERGLRSEIAALRNELEQKQAALAFRDDELRAAGTQVAALQQRVADLELARRQAATANAEIDSIRRSLAEEVANLQHEVEVKEKELTHRYEAVTAVELALHGRIQALQQELARVQETSSAYEVELETHRAQSAALQNRVVELERSQTETNSLEATRQQLENDLNRLRADLAQKEYLVTGQARALANLETRSAAEIATLRQQLEQERSSAASANDEVRQAHAEFATSREALEAQLRQKDDEIEGLRASATGQTEQLSNRINELQLQLAEKQLLADSRASELGDLRTTVSQLSEQLSEKDDHYAQALGLWQNTEAQHNNQIAQLSAAHEELSRVQTALEVQLDQARGANAGLRGELQEAKKRTAELETLLQSSEAAKTAVESDRARLRSSLEEIEALHDRSKMEAARELAEVRRALETELTELRGELQQKAWSLAQQQASIENLAQVHREQIRKLEARLGEQQPVTEQQARELEQAVNRAETLQQQVEALQAEIQQTQAAGARQAELIRQDYAARLESANALLAAKSAELAKSGAVRANVEESLRAEITRLNNEMRSRAAALQSREDELDRVRAEMTSVQNRIVRLESVTARTESEAREISQAKNSLESDLASLRDELQQKSAAVMQQQTAIDDLAGRHRSQVEQLEANLSEYQRASEDRRREVDRAQAQIALLHSRVEELQAAMQQTELSANSRTEQLRQEYQARVDALSRELADNAAQLHDRVGISSDIEQALRSQIDRLIGEAQERNQILHNRNDELVRVKGELDSLSERFTQLQTHAIQAESSASDDAERMRTEYQAQLALLQADLSQKEWALEERQAIIAGIEQQHRQQIESLRQKLAAKEQSAAPADGAFVMGDPNLTEAQQEKLRNLDDMVKATRAGDDASYVAPSGRRWQSGFGWKRRWRS